MGATLIPWWDDPATVKPNEFERGVMTGMLLACGQKDDGGGGTPTDYTNVPLPTRGATIETSVTKDSVSEDGTKEYWNLHQKITYYDGTVQTYSQPLSRTAGSNYFLVGKDIFYGWEFGEPDTNGCITDVKYTFYYWWNKKDVTETIRLRWYIPTTEPQRVIDE